MRLALLAALVLLAPVPQDPLKVQIQTDDNSSFTGTVALPVEFKVGTKYGVARVRASDVTEFRAANEKWTVSTALGTSYTGTVDLADPLELVTAFGTLKIPLKNLRTVSFVNARRGNTPPLRAPRFKGYEVRKHAERYTPEAALLLPGNTHVALLDYSSNECLRVDLATGACDRVKVDEEPSALALKDGKLYVASRKVAAIIVIDAATFKPAGRIAIADPVWQLAAPILPDRLYASNSNRAPQVIDTTTGKVSTMEGQFHGLLTPTADGTEFYRQMDGGRPPDLAAADGRNLVNPRFDSNRRAGPMLQDVIGGRLYCGGAISSLRLGESIGDLDVNFCAVHPTLSLIVGPQRRLDEPYRASATLAVVEEEFLDPIVAFPVGDDVVAVLLTERLIVAISQTSVYPIELEAVVPKEARGKPRVRRTAINPDVKISADDAKKAAALCDEAWKTLDAAGFEAALKLDPWSDASAGLAVAKKDLDAAAVAADGPMRDPRRRPRVIGELARMLIAAKRLPEAHAALNRALLADGTSARLWRLAGEYYEAAGADYGAAMAYGRSLKIEKSDDLAKRLPDLETALKKKLKVECAACRGVGKVEVDIDGATVERECESCSGAGKVWPRPCVDCVHQGLTRTHCTTCNGRGCLWEGAP